MPEEKGDGVGKDEQIGFGGTVGLIAWFGHEGPNRRQVDNRALATGDHAGQCRVTEADTGQDMYR